MRKDMGLQHCAHAIHTARRCAHHTKTPIQAIKRVEFSDDGTKLLAVTEKRMGFLGTIVTFDIPRIAADADFPDEPSLKITLEDSKATVAGWGPLSDLIVACHEDGSISQFDGSTGEKIYSTQIHSETITDLQWAPDRTYFITTSKV